MRHVIPLGAGGRAGRCVVEGVAGGGVWGGRSLMVVVRRVLRFLVDILNKVIIVLYMLLLFILLLLL